MVTILGDGRVTRDVEDWVYHELPFLRALCYRHAYYSRSPWVWTVATVAEAVSADVMAQVEDLVARVPVDVDE